MATLYFNEKIISEKEIFLKNFEKASKCQYYACQCDLENRCGLLQERESSEELDAKTREDHDHERHGQECDGRSEVGFASDQEERESHEASPDDPIAHPSFTSAPLSVEGREHERDRRARELRWLEVEWTKIDPPPRTTPFHAKEQRVHE